MVEQDLTLHVGQDFDITYVVPPESDMTLSQYKGACKIRKRPYDNMILELHSVVESKQVRFFISGQESVAKNSFITMITLSRLAKVRLRSFLIFQCIIKGEVTYHGR